MVGFEKALGAVKVIKDQIQQRSQSLLSLARGYFILLTEYHVILPYHVTDSCLECIIFNNLDLSKVR